MKFATAYMDYKDRVLPTLACDPREKMARDSEKDSCDINLIMARYEKTGQLPMMARGEPVFGDFSEVVDYQRSLELVSLAEEQFMALPAEVRAECQNDPAVFLERVRDPEWAVKHRLALPPSAPGLVAAEGGKAAGQAAGGTSAGAAARASKSGTSDAE